MAYNSGSNIEASDINDFISKVNTLFGDGGEDFTGTADHSYGYGQNISTFNINTGDIADSSEWDYMFGLVSDLGQHQGTPVLNESATTGDLIEAFNSLNTDISDLESNRFDVSNVTISSIDSSTRTADWTTDLEHEIQASSVSFDTIRYFFNSGGKIELTVSSSAFTNFNTVFLTATEYYNVLNGGEQSVYSNTNGNYTVEVFVTADDTGTLNIRMLLTDDRADPPTKSADVTSTYEEHLPDTAAFTATPITFTQTTALSDATDPFTLSTSSPDASPTCTYDTSTNTDCTASTTITANVSGGSGSFNYTWTKVSGSGTITSGQGTDTITVEHTSSEGTFSGDFEVTVDDTGTGQTETSTQTITFNHVDDTTAFTLSTTAGDTNPTCTYDPGNTSDCTASTTITANTTDGSGNFSYTWSETTSTSAIIASGQGTDTITVENTSGEGTTSADFQVTVEDTSTGQTETDTQTITFEHVEVASVNLTNQTVFTEGQTSPDGAVAEAQIYFNSDGVLEHRVEYSDGTSSGGTPNTVSQTTTITDEWATSSPDSNTGFGDDYEIECVVSSGTVDGTSPTGSGNWLTLSNDRDWYIRMEQSGTGTRSADLSISIRDSSTNNIVETATITLSVQIQS